MTKEEKVEIITEIVNDLIDLVTDDYGMFWSEVEVPLTEIVDMMTDYLSKNTYIE